MAEMISFARELAVVSDAVKVLECRFQLMIDAQRKRHVCATKALFWLTRYHRVSKGTDCYKMTVSQKVNP